MTVGPIPAMRAMFTAAGITAPVRARHETTEIPRVRLELTGGTDAIPGIHDQALVEVWCYGADYNAADTLARTLRSALTVGTWAGSVVTKIRSTPPRYEDGGQFDPAQGVARFTARVWLHGA